MVVKGPWIASSRGRSVTKIVAGGDHCFVICAEAGVSSMVSLQYIALSYIKVREARLKYIEVH